MRCRTNIRQLLAAGAVALATSSGPGMAQDGEMGRALYESYCASCHGPSGRGDGRMAALLVLEPTDLSLLAAANGGAFPVLAVVQQIDGRARSLAHGGDMPIFGRWFEGDGPDAALATRTGQTVMVARPIADLVTYLQEIQS